MLISGLRGMGLWELAVQTLRNSVQHDMTTYAAALAFRMLLALFPFIIVLLALVGALGVPEFFRWLLDQAQAALPPSVYGLVAGVIGEIQGEANRGLISFGLIAALWTASAGVRSLIKALNAAANVHESRPPWQLYPLSLLYTVGLALLLLAAAALMLVGPRVMQWLAGHVGLTDTFVTLWTWLRLPVAVLLLLAAVALIYHMAPSARQPFVLITPGAVLAVVVWGVASLAFSTYVTVFGNFGATYGSLGGVIIVLLYFYLSAIVLLVGAEINAVIAHFAQAGTAPLGDGSPAGRGVAVGGSSALKHPGGTRS